MGGLLFVYGKYMQIHKQDMYLCMQDKVIKFNHKPSCLLSKDNGYCKCDFSVQSNLRSRVISFSSKILQDYT